MLRKIAVSTYALAVAKNVPSMPRQKSLLTAWTVSPVAPSFPSVGDALTRLQPQREHFLLPRPHTASHDDGLGSRYPHRVEHCEAATHPTLF